MFNSILKDSLPVLGKYAPMVATALGYPTAGAVAFGILNALYELTSKHVLEAPSAINKNPELLKKAEGNFVNWAHNNLEKDENNEFKFV
jgi:hypothetical protein